MGLQQRGAAARPPPAGAGELGAALAGTLLQANAASPSRGLCPSEGDVGEEQDQVAGSSEPLWDLQCWSVSNAEPNSPLGGEERRGEARAALALTK